MRITIDVPELLVPERRTGPTWEALEYMLGTLIDGPGDPDSARERAWLVLCAGERKPGEPAGFTIRVQSRERSVLHNGCPTEDYTGTVTFEPFGPAIERSR